MVDNFKVSVVMPCYNGSKNIKRSIDSFLDQHYENKELIVVDGKSTDGSHAIIAHYCSQYSNIKWIKEQDVNVTDALNIGIKFSDADFIGFLMTDDHYCDPDFFVESMRLAKYIDFDVLFSNTYYYLTHTEKKILHYWRPGVHLNRGHMLRNGSSIAIIDSSLVRKSIFEEHQLDPSYNLCSDYEFFLRIADEKRLFLYLDRFTTSCLYQGDNLSAKNTIIQVKMFSKVAIKFVANDLPDESYLLFHRIIIGDKMNEGELTNAENLLLHLVSENNKVQFYEVGSFDLYVKNLWKRVVGISQANKIHALYTIYSSLIYNNGVKTMKLIIFAKVVLRRLKR